MKFAVIGLLCVGVLATVGCAGGPGVPTAPSATAPVVDSSLSASERSGDLHATKECSEFASGSLRRFPNAATAAGPRESRSLEEPNVIQPKVEGIAGAHLEAD